MGLYVVDPSLNWVSPKKQHSEFAT
jgi:hypothetical protein